MITNLRMQLFEALVGSGYLDGDHGGDAGHLAAGVLRLQLGAQHELIVGRVRGLLEAGRRRGRGVGLLQVVLPGEGGVRVGA